MLKFTNALLFDCSVTDCETIFGNFCNHVSQQLNFNTWHKRVGHIPYQRMMLLPLHFDSKVVQQAFFCVVCPKAKQQRLPFQLSSITSTSPFELIHVDI